MSLIPNSLFAACRLLQIGVLTLLLISCTGLPGQVTPVQNFELDRYLGSWYEIARLDHSFERGMDHVTADYSMREDGGVRVLNRGFLTADNQWQDAEGRAYFIGDPDIAHLKVSFFGPFFGSYAVFELDKDNYQYAFVSGNTHKYLWLLARTPTVDPDVISLFEARATDLGFDLQDLIYVEQD